MQGELWDSFDNHIFLNQFVMRKFALKEKSQSMVNDALGFLMVVLFHSMILSASLVSS